MTATTISEIRNLFPEAVLSSLKDMFNDAAIDATLLDIPSLQAMAGASDQLGCWLSAGEQQKLQSYTLEKRRNEWLAGRLCAKLSVNRSPKRPYSRLSEIIIDNASDGRPYLRSADGWNRGELDLSISHSGKYAVALVAGHYCGVDIQESRSTLVRIKDRFCTPDDETMLAHAFCRTPMETELNLLWAAKEAVRKTLSYDHVPDFLALEVDEITLVDSGCHTFRLRYRQRAITVGCCQLHGYALAASILQE